MGIQEIQALAFILFRSAANHFEDFEVLGRFKRPFSRTAWSISSGNFDFTPDMLEPSYLDVVATG